MKSRTLTGLRVFEQNWRRCSLKISINPDPTMKFYKRPTSVHLIVIDKTNSHQIEFKNKTGFHAELIKLQTSWCTFLYLYFSHVISDFEYNVSVALLHFHLLKLFCTVYVYFDTGILEITKHID